MKNNNQHDYYAILANITIRQEEASNNVLTVNN